jgi:hypothetical protein|tara:strand:+ start:578 stop:1108 length:531 start_codon:yes stop_codon:yes gene_type:complete
MALWGNNDNITAHGTVSLNYSTRVVTGSNSGFGESGKIQEGDVIRFGSLEKPGTYFGDAVVVSIASTSQLTIASTAGLSGAAIAATSYTASQLPKFAVDGHYSERNTAYSAINYGVAAAGSADAAGTVYETGVGWVGVTTYTDNAGNLRVKKEILCAMSGISTGNAPSYPNVVDAN